MAKKRLKLTITNFKEVQSFILKDENLTLEQKIILLRLNYQAARENKVKHFAPAQHGSPVKIEPFGVDEEGRIYVRMISVPGEYEIAEKTERPEPSEICIDLEDFEPIEKIEEPEKKKVIGKKLTLL